MAIVLSLIICEDIIDLTTSDNAILGIHLLYKTDITMSDEYDSTTEDEKSLRLASHAYKPVSHFLLIQINSLWATITESEKSRTL